MPLPFPRVVLPRVITLAMAHELGFSSAQVHRRVGVGVWTELAPAVYCTSPPHELRDLIHAGSHHAAPGGMLTGAAALTVHGFQHVGPFDHATVLVPYSQGIRTTPLVTVRRAVHLPPPLHMSGLVVAPVARAVVDHAMTLRFRDDVRAVVARSVQRHGCRPDQLAEALTHVATRGSKLTRTVIAEISAGARSAPEARAAGLMTDGGITGFEQNASLAAWGLAYNADFLWASLRAVLEVDSVEFHFDDDRYTSTLDRAGAIKARGFDTMHVAPRLLVDQPEVFVRRTRQWLTARAELLGLAPPLVG